MNFDIEIIDNQDHPELIIRIHSDNRKEIKKLHDLILEVILTHKYRTDRRP